MKDVQVKNIVRDLNVLIKNSVLYNLDHPLFKFSMNNFRASLDTWFVSNEQFNLGVSPDRIFLDGEEISGKEDYYKEAAGYLHARGIIMVSFKKGVQESELTDFFGFVRKDIKAFRMRQETEKSVPSGPHLKVKTIDYSAFLTSAKNGITKTVSDIWQELFNIARETEEHKLPESKIEFLVNFFKDPQKAAYSLNKVYQDALSRLNAEEAARDIQGTIAGIYAYFEKNAKNGTEGAKSDLMRVIARLHPDIIARFFERITGSSKGINLSEEILNNFPDSFIAEFIELMIKNDGEFNENFLKVFDKLMPEEEKASSVASILADKLFDKGDLDPEGLSKLQVSIKEIFKSHPKNDFLSNMYKMTVDACVNRKIDRLVYIAKLSPLIARYVKSVEEEKLKTEETILALNIIWLENDADEFKKMCGKLSALFEDLLAMKDARNIKKILEFFTDKLRPEQRKNRRINFESGQMIDKITQQKTISEIISFIPASCADVLNDIAYIVDNSARVSADMVIDRFIKEQERLAKSKFGAVLGAMKENASAGIIERIRRGEVYNLKELFEILMKYAPDKAQAISKNLLNNKFPLVRMEGVKAFKPITREEREELFRFFKKEKNKEIKKKAMAILLKTGDNEIISGLFRYFKKPFSDKRLLSELVELAGCMKETSAFEHLKEIFSKAPFFNTQANDELRAKTAAALRLLNTGEALALIKQGLGDKRPRVRLMCETIMKLKET